MIYTRSCIVSGAFTTDTTGGTVEGGDWTTHHKQYSNKFNASNVVPTAQENRVKNRLIRIYKRVN